MEASSSWNGASKSDVNGGSGGRVAVIGGGAAGIVSAKWLLEAGLEVVVFEKAAQLGGVWRYDDDATDSNSCTYKASYLRRCLSLRTNLPTAIMQLRDFAYPPGVPSYPSYVEVRDYLAQYATHFGVDKVVRFHSTVTNVSKTEDGRQWKVLVHSTRPGGTESNTTKLFDRLVVCNGHYSKPFCVSIAGIEHFRGEVMHSQKYRTPDRFADKSVLLIGHGPSGGEISAELAAGGAKAVTVAFPRHKPPPPLTENSNQADDVPKVVILGIEPDGSLLLSDGTRIPPSEFEEFRAEMARAASKNDTRVMKPKVDHITSDGNTVVFTDGSSIPAPDVVIFCTGYVYAVSDFFTTDLFYPKALALRGEAKIQLEADLVAELHDATAAGFAVAPLYKQVVAIEDPSVAFIGLPFDTVPFQCSELQAMWIAKVFSGALPLASKKQMYQDFYEEVRQQERPLGRNFHQLGAKRHIQYFSEVAALAHTELDMVGVQLLVDAVGLAISFPTEFRTATYLLDPSSGKCTRRFTPKGSPVELVKTFG